MFQLSQEIIDHSTLDPDDDSLCRSAFNNIFIILTRLPYPRLLVAKAVVTMEGVQRISSPWFYVYQVVTFVLLTLNAK